MNHSCTLPHVLTPKYPHMLHGGDYNPEQWLGDPSVLEKDLALFKKAHINCVTLGVFSWAKLEPEENIYTLDWLEDIINTLYDSGIYTILATPSGARPQWLAQKYPEVLRVRPDGGRNFFGERQNHCYTSPLYRSRVQRIDSMLAQRFAEHPGVILWHISNEFGGECHCEQCQAAFRIFLQEKYGSLEALNHAYWADFWAHSYTDWAQIHSPSPVGETSVHGLNLDWRRFVTRQTIDFMQMEIAAVKAFNPAMPVTTNMMNQYVYELNYYAFRDKLDVIAWDSYPAWHPGNGDNVYPAMETALCHDMMRSLKMQPFLLMESTPSTTNWQPVSKLKKPGMHALSMIQAIAHGADSAQLFQLRASRGSAEKFHSALISHTGTGNTRVFREVSAFGAELEKLSDHLYGSGTPAEVAILHDVESCWALDNTRGPRNAGLDYFGELHRHYSWFFRSGIGVELIDSTFDLDKYRLVIAPMLYLFREGIQEKLRAFVAGGGTLVLGAFSGVADDTDLVFTGEESPEKLSDVLGLWVEEVDALYDEECNTMTYGGRTYALHQLCEIMHPTTAQVLCSYEKDFYAGTPVLTKNTYGAGTAYHIGALAEGAFHEAFYAGLTAELGLVPPLGIVPPYGTAVNVRVSGSTPYLFLQNFTDRAQTLPLDQPYIEIRTDEMLSGEIALPPYGYAVLTPAEDKDKESEALS